MSVSSLVSFNNTKRRVVFLLLVTYATDAIKCMQLNALFCCLWRNLEGSCHKHFFVVSCYQRCRLLPAIPVTTCGTVNRQRRIDNSNTWPVAALTACSEASYRLRIVIFTYPTCIRRPIRGVSLGILPYCLIRKN